MLRVDNPKPSQIWDTEQPQTNNLIWYQDKVWPLLLTDPGCVFVCGRVWDFTTGHGAADPVGILCVRGGGMGSVCWPLADLCPADPAAAVESEQGCRGYPTLSYTLSFFHCFSPCRYWQTCCSFSRRVCVSMWCVCGVWSATSAIMTDKRQAGSRQTDSDHTHVLSFLLFATQSPSFFRGVGRCSCNR